LQLQLHQLWKSCGYRDVVIKRWLSDRAQQVEFTRFCNRLDGVTAADCNAVVTRTTMATKAEGVLRGKICGLFRRCVEILDPATAPAAVLAQWKRRADCGYRQIEMWHDAVKGYQEYLRADGVAESQCLSSDMMDVDEALRKCYKTTDQNTQCVEDQQFFVKSKAAELGSCLYGRFYIKELFRKCAKKLAISKCNKVFMSYPYSQINVVYNKVLFPLYWTFGTQAIVDIYSTKPDLIDS